MIKCDINRIEDKIKTFSTFGDDKNGGITRYALSKEDELARTYFKTRMENIGAEVVFDDYANMYAILKGSDSLHKKIVMASHCDSVLNGGNYDGILGVICAMEVLETIKKENIPHKHDVVAMIWTNEEGSLYPPAIMVSGMLCKKYLPENIASNYDEEKMFSSRDILTNKTTFKEALDKFKYKGEYKNRLNPHDYLAMFEAHIEQGPILETSGNDIGVVGCVLGMVNYSIIVEGQANHAGTTPMKYRKDALLTLSKILVELHNKIDELKIDDLVYTNGQICVKPNVHTVIPSYAEIMIDVRHIDHVVLQKVAEIINSFDGLKLDGCLVKTKLNWSRDTTYFDPRLVNFVKSSADELGYKNQFINSGAGHDAQFASYMLPTTMIFAPSKNGRSHCDEEYTSLDHCHKLATTLLHAVLKTDKDF